MTLQDLGSIGELLGAIGVILSLVYLATQIRQNTKSLRAAAVDAAADRYIESTRLISLNPELADLLEKGRSDYTALSGVQQRRYRLHYLANSLAFENMFQKYRQGMIPESQWEGIAGALRHTMDQAGPRQAWEVIRSNVGPEFREYVDAMFEAAGHGE
jgi:hypothetical protein